MGTWAAWKGAGGRQHEAGGAGRKGEGGVGRTCEGGVGSVRGKVVRRRWSAEQVGTAVSRKGCGCWQSDWAWWSATRNGRAGGYGVGRAGGAGVGHTTGRRLLLVRAAVGRERWQRLAAWGGDATAGVGGDKQWWSSRERGCVGGGAGRPRGGAVGRGGAGWGVADRLRCHAAIKWILVHLASSRHTLHGHHDRCH